MRALVVLALLLLAPPAGADDGVQRAIGTFRPDLSKAQRRAWAAELGAVARRHGFDPYTAVALCGHESRWRPTAVSPDGEDLGLCQIRARFVGACRSDPDPVHAPGPGCRAVRAALLTVTGNLSVFGGAITQWRKTCRKITGRPAMLAHLLHGYGGMGNLAKRRVCGQERTARGWRDLPIPRPVKAIMACRLRLRQGKACLFRPTPRRG